MEELDSFGESEAEISDKKEQLKISADLIFLKKKRLATNKTIAKILESYNQLIISLNKKLIYLDHLISQKEAEASK